MLAAACSACSVISADDFSGAQDDPQAPPPRQTTDGFGDAGDDGGSGHGGRTPTAPPPPPLDGGDDGGGADAGITPKTTFTDDFGRADGSTIGNGWIPKNAGKWSLSGGSVLEANSTLTYKDLLVQRPSSEAALDVELSVDATLPGSGGDVGLYARVQSASSAQGSLVSYTFYPGDFGVAYVDHDIGTGNSLAVSSMGLNPPLVGGQTIHMVLRVTGTSPVHIYASISDTSGKLLGSLSVDDNTASPIVTAGSHGFGSGGGGSRFDNYQALVY
jgi:hypothetical protein